MVGWLKQRINKSINSFLDRRLKQTREFVLNRHRIFIFPSRLGMGLLVVILLMLLMGINYQNNLVYLVCFWLLALLVINILYTYRNLSGLIIRAVRTENCFAGRKAVFELEVSSNVSKRYFQAIVIGWHEVDFVHVDVPPNEQVRMQLSHPAKQRGVIRAPRIGLVTHFPTGLCRAWAYAPMDMKALVYPEPKNLEPKQLNDGLGEESEDGAEIPRGNSDFGSVRNYQPGDSLKQIHWPSYAKTGELATREFVDYQSHDLWLDFNSLQIPGTESRLSHLCFKILQFYDEQKTYGLRIGNQTIEPAQGEQHKNRCLAELATFGLAEEFKQ